MNACYTSYAEMRCHVNALLHSIGGILAELVGTDHGGFQDAAQVLDSHLHVFFDAFHRLRAHNEQSTALQVAIVALTKSGKSTLLNALTSAECLPVNNVPETACVCKLSHVASSMSSQPVLRDGEVTITGQGNIRSYLQELNVSARQHHVQHSSPVHEEHVHIHLPISALLQLPDDSSATQLVLLDTPGPNEAGEEMMRYQVERVLQDVDVVLYLLDYTKLRTAEEAAMLERLKAINPHLLQRLSQRMFFVVNKVDMSSVSEGLGPEEVRCYVADLVNSQLQLHPFCLEPEQVLLVSARDALTARLVLGGQASPDVLARFRNVAFGRFAAHKVTDKQVREAAEQLLASSQIAELEEAVLGFLYSYGGVVRTLAELDNIARLLQEMYNAAIACQSCLRQHVAELEAQMMVLRGQVGTTMAAFSAALSCTHELQAVVVDELRQQLHQLRSRLRFYLSMTFDKPTPASSSSSSSSSIHSHSSCAASSAPLPPTWQVLRERVRVLQASGGRSSTAQALREQVLQVNEQVTRQIKAEVSDFWHSLECAASARHAQLARQINTALHSVSRTVEAAVGAALDVQLGHVHLKLQPPTAEQFHGDLAKLVERAVARGSERHLRVAHTQYEERVMLPEGGICRWGSRWVSLPKVRTCVETYMAEVFRVQLDEVHCHYIEVVDAAISATEGAVEASVQEYVGGQVAAAREKLSGYCNSYLASMEAALASSCSDSVSRQRACEQVGVLVDAVAALQGEAAGLQAQLEAKLPGRGWQEDDLLVDMCGSEHSSSEACALPCIGEEAGGAGGYGLQDGAAGLHRDVEDLDSGHCEELSVHGSEQEGAGSGAGRCEAGSNAEGEHMRGQEWAQADTRRSSELQGSGVWCGAADEGGVQGEGWSGACGGLQGQEHTGAAKAEQTAAPDVPACPSALHEAAEREDSQPDACGALQPGCDGAGPDEARAHTGAAGSGFESGCTMSASVPTTTSDEGVAPHSPRSSGSSEVSDDWTFVN